MERMFRGQRKVKREKCRGREKEKLQQNHVALKITLTKRPSTERGVGGKRMVRGGRD